MAGLSVEKNLEKIRARVSEACTRCGRKPVDVRLVAVSKMQSTDMIEEAMLAGHKLFGENYVQEVIPKQKLISGAEWHFIGGLQSNKAKQIVGLFDLIHSVDRESVLSEISKRAVEKRIVQKILIEINLAGEIGKGGIDWKSAEELLQKARHLPGVSVRGLMGMPPAGTAESSRPYFKMLREKLLAWRSDEEFRELSMGTSQDFEIAIEEGATLVRVGTEIFGSRRSES